MCCGGAKTVVRAVKGFMYAAGGINEEMAKKRLQQCHNCPYLRGGTTCSICGCFVDSKTRLPNESCPDTPKRWTTEKIG